MATVAVTLIMGLYVWQDGPGASLIQWVALLPACMSLLFHVLSAQGHDQPASEHPTTSAPAALRQQVEDLTNMRDLMLALGASLDRAVILDKLMQAVTELLHFDRCLLLLSADDDDQMLIFGAYSQAAPDPESQFLLEQIQIALEDGEDDPLLGRWLGGEAVLVTDITPYLRSSLNWVLTTLDLQQFYALPLMRGTQLKGALIADNTQTRRPITQQQRALLDALAAYIAITLDNVRLYQLTDEQLAARVRELEILSQIDRELNHTLSIDRILTLAVDWILRFTNSDAAAVALIDHERGTLCFEVGYGYDQDAWEQLTSQNWPLTQGVTGRVARTREAANVPDVSADPDFVEVMPGVRSQLSVPVIREDRVLAIISCESKKNNAFDTANLEFVQRLASRAATAIDNADLLDEMRRERQKLEVILSSTADAVVVVDHDGKLVLVNQAAMSAFGLSPKEQYAGQAFADVFHDTPLVPLVERARTIKQGLIEEMALPGGKTLHVSIVPAPAVGWLIVMHDITPYKKTDQLKNELLATTSHDLKNPLSTIMGYVDLIHMTNPINEQGMGYIARIQQAVVHMRRLIDDLLDMARIDSGITLNYTDVYLPSLFNNISVRFMPQATEKSITLAFNVPADLPPVPADEQRLHQILANLISNAIKYTPPEGHIWVNAEMLDGLVRISVKDDGMGISPEDQPQVFQRFFRVRTAETDHIEGTGLGLAIVKSLVEAHKGQIGLESRLGEGSTFHVTLPLEAAQAG